MITVNNIDEIPEGTIKTITRNGQIECYAAGDDEVLKDEARKKSINDAVARFEKKQARSGRVNKITVTTEAGNTFDGDEKSQDRMTRAIVVMDDIETINWVLADNTVIQANKQELIEALRLAGQQQAALWLIE